MWDLVRVDVRPGGDLEIASLNRSIVPLNKFYPEAAVSLVNSLKPALLRTGHQISAGDKLMNFSWCCTEELLTCEFCCTYTLI